MKKLTPLFVALLIFLLIVFFIAPGTTYLDRIERRLVESLVNHWTREYFASSLRLSRVHLDRHLRLHVENAEGNLQTRDGQAPLKASRIDSLDSLANLLIQKPVRFRFEGLKPARSIYQGIEGEALVLLGPEGYFAFKSRILSIGLEDITWIDPVNLSGSSGRMSGEFAMKMDNTQNPSFGLNLSVEEPGGNVQAKFFDILLPYLPQSKIDADKIRAIKQTTGLISYQRASLGIQLAEVDKMKILFRIFVPGYNLQLNLNVEVRLEEKCSFLQIAQIMGLIEVKPS